MSQAGQRRDRTDDLSWAMQRVPEAPRLPPCWICSRPGATETRVFGSTGNTRVPYCPAGVGCRDGRIYHGPLASPHWPGEQCDYCARHGEPSTGQRIAGNRAKPTTRASNSSKWHR